MLVIPAINETKWEGIEKKIQAAKDFGADWVHIDVTDGIFAANRLWNDPGQLQASGVALQANIEVHLMVENPDGVIGAWIAAGVKRIIVHVESANDIETIKAQCEAAGVELVIAAKPDTPVQELIDCRNYARTFLILSVAPGFSGQKFQEDQLEKIKILRNALPDAVIEVDGGVSLETAPRIASAGASILVAASVIWNGSSPEEAYYNLSQT